MTTSHHLRSATAALPRFSLAAFILTLALAGMLSAMVGIAVWSVRGGPSITQADVAQARELAYRQGYGAGRADGLQAGRKAGARAGARAGLAKGRKDGYATGFMKGRLVGYRRGRASGYADGFAAGQASVPAAPVKKHSGH